MATVNDGGSNLEKNYYSYLKIANVVLKTPKKDVQMHGITVHEQYS